MNIAALSGFLFCFLAILFGIAMSDSFDDYFSGFKSFTGAFKLPSTKPEDITSKILEMSDIARKEGLLSLEEKSEDIQNEFLSKGIRLIVDGTDPELVKDILENELFHKDERNRKNVRFWQDMNSIGPNMSLALITTLYGSVIANWICTPIARKIEKNSEKDNLIMELTIEGVLSIQSGENSRIIKEKIKSILEMNEEKEDDS